MSDPKLEDLAQVAAANREVPWGDFVCTPVVDFAADGKAAGTVKRCAITAGGTTVVVRLPSPVKIGKGHAWPPKAIVDAMMEAVGPPATV